MKELSSTITFVVFTKQPPKWEEFFSFCRLWGFEVHVFSSLDEMSSRNLRFEGSSVWFLTNEAEFAQHLADNPNTLILPTTTIPNFVKFLEEYSIEIVPPVENKK